MEEKDRVKERIGHSPDLTDAWLNSFAEQQIEGVASWFNLQKKSIDRQMHTGMITGKGYGETTKETR
jgi:hypothetical protein